MCSQNYSQKQVWEIYATDYFSSFLYFVLDVLRDFFQEINLLLLLHSVKETVFLSFQTNTNFNPILTGRGGGRLAPPFS